MKTVVEMFGVKEPKLWKPKELRSIDCINPALVMGVELETENAHRNADGYVANLPGFTVDRDNSLRGGDTAYEFISKPMHHATLLGELEKFFEYTKFNDDNYSDRTSIHVHTNVTDYTQDQLASLSMTYTVFEEVLFEFVNHYKKRTDYGYSRDTNLYCIPWNQCFANHKLVTKLFGNPAGLVTRWQKYTALNFLPMTTIGTVEWRHMHGSADMVKIKTWLDVIGGIMEYAKKTSFEDVVKVIQSLNDTSAYQAFFNEVLRNSLTYVEAYRKPMSDGVINAKFALMTWDKNKKPEKASVYDRVILEDLMEEPGLLNRAQVQEVRARPANRNRVVLNAGTAVAAGHAAARQANAIHWGFEDPAQPMTTRQEGVGLANAVWPAAQERQRNLAQELEEVLAREREEARRRTLEHQERLVRNQGGNR